MLRHVSPISGIASYNHQFVATAGYDNCVILWNALSKSAIAIGHHDHLSNHCEFSACGKYLVTSSSDHTARIWSVPQMKLLTVLSEHKDDVECSSIHPNQHLVATASRDHKVRVFNFKGELLKEMIGHQADVTSVQWSDDTKNLISSSDDGTIRVWDVEKSKQFAYLNDSGIQTDAIAVSNDGIVYAGDDIGQVHILSNNSKNSIPAHKAGVKKIVYSKQHRKLISVAYDRTACIWNVLPNGAIQLHHEIMLHNIIWARACAFHGDEEIVFATFGDTYAVYNYEKKQWEVDHINDTKGINTVLAVCDDIWTIGDAGVLKVNQTIVRKLPSLCNFLVLCGDVLITGGQTGDIFDAKLGTVLYNHRSPLNCAVSYECDGKCFAIIGSYTGECIILRRESNDEVVFDRLILLHYNAIKSLAVNDNVLFSICATGDVAWYNLKTNKQLKFIKNAHDKIANGCAALEDRYFASVSRDLLLRFWDDTYSLKFKILTPHTHSVKCIATDSSFRYLATGSYNGTVAIFDRHKIRWHINRICSSGISSICFDKINQRFLASSFNGNIYPFSIKA